MVKPSTMKIVLKRLALSLNHRLKWKKYSTKMIKFLHHQANSLAALNALETLTAYLEAKSSNPDGALKMIYGLYESAHDVNI